MQAYVTRQEFDIVKAELEKLSVAVQVLSDGQLKLTQSVADLSERMEAGFAEADTHVDTRFDALKHLIEARHAELVSALMSMGKR